MKKIIVKIKNNLKSITAFIIGGILFSGISYAATIASSGIQYNKNEQTTVEGALDDLYAKANNQLPKMSDMCPECKFTFAESTLYLASSSSATVLTDDQINSLKTNWEDVVISTHIKTFLGLVVNGSTKKIDRAFACSINNGVPFCIEGVKSTDSRKEEVYAANMALFQSKMLFDSDSSHACSSGCHDSVSASFNSSGSVYTYGNYGSGPGTPVCEVVSSGYVWCCAGYCN